MEWRQSAGRQKRTLICFSRFQGLSILDAFQVSYCSAAGRLSCIIWEICLANFGHPMYCFVVYINIHNDIYIYMYVYICIYIVNIQLSHCQGPFIMYMTFPSCRSGINHTCCSFYRLRTAIWEEAGWDRPWAIGSICAVASNWFPCSCTLERGRSSAFPRWKRREWFIQVLDRSIW